MTENPEFGNCDVWHDRAVFHFLTDPAERGSYVELARKPVSKGGSLVIATFADDGRKRSLLGSANTIRTSLSAAARGESPAIPWCGTPV